MNRTILEATVSEKTKISKDVVADVVQAVIDTITETLRSGNAVKLTSFATIGVKQVKARKGKNPKTGEPIDILAHNKITIKAGKKLGAVING
jgi:DNA-binding protein HU-beta